MRATSPLSFAPPARAKSTPASVPSSRTPVPIHKPSRPPSAPHSQTSRTLSSNKKGHALACPSKFWIVILLCLLRLPTQKCRHVQIIFWHFRRDLTHVLRHLMHHARRRLRQLLLHRH